MGGKKLDLAASPKSAASQIIAANECGPDVSGTRRYAGKNPKIDMLNLCAFEPLRLCVKSLSPAVLLPSFYGLDGWMEKTKKAVK
jgi:hypothetical protein